MLILNYTMNKFIFFTALFRYWIQKKNPVYEMLMKEKVVLDIACGEGELLQKNPEKIHGIDINPTMVSKLQKLGLQVKEGNVVELPYQDDFFEVVHCSNIIEHLAPADAYRMFQEMFRVLKPGGKIILVTPMPKTIWYSFGHVKPYPPQSIKKLFRAVSMEAFDSIQGLGVGDTFYYGRSIANKFTFLISTIFANLAPETFAGSYLMVISKYEK